MKRLMITLSAAALAFGAFADGEVTWPVGESFNGSTDIPATITKGASSETSISTEEYSWSQELMVGRPNMFAETNALNNLNVKTAFNAPDYYKPFGDTAQAIPATHLYFDSLVKFTACDEAPDMTAYSGAKLVVWLKEIEDGNTVTQKVMVTAGKLDSEYVPSRQDYDCGYIGDYGFASDADWCRLTIKAVADVTGGSSVPGFVVFVNGVTLTISSPTDVGIAESALTGPMSVWRHSDHLFPSLVAQTATITEVGFAGQGAVDDVTFAKTEPTIASGKEFAKDKDPDLATVNGVPYTSSGDIQDAIDRATAGAAVVLVRSFEGDLVFPNACASTLELGAFTLNGGVSAEGEEGCSVTISGSGKIEGLVAIDRDETITLVSGKIKASTNLSIAENVTPAKGYKLVTCDDGAYWTVAEITEDGSAEKPWKIATASDLTEKLLAHATSGHYFKQTADIALTGTWSPIASFNGSYDGGNYTISNLVFARANGTYQGLFGQVTSATNRNIRLVLAGWTGEPKGTTGDDAEYGGAALAGKANTFALFENIVVSGSTTGATHNVAGIVCRTYGGNFTFNNCTNRAEIGGGYTKVGGLVNMVGVSGTTTFNDCSNEGRIWVTNPAKGENGGVGAFVAYTADAAKVVLSGCSSTGTLENQNSDGQGVGAFVNAPNAGAGSVSAGAKPNVASATYLPGMIRTSYYTGFGAAVVKDGLATWYADYTAAMAALGDATAVKVFVKNNGGSPATTIAAAIDFTEIANVAEGKVGVGTKVNKDITADLATYAVADTYLEKNGDTYTVTAKTTPEITITGIPEISEFTSAEFPTPTVTVTGGLDYTGVWDPATVTEPAVGATNTYVYTVTVAATAKTLAASETATWKVYKTAAPAGFKVILTWSDANIESVNYSIDGADSLNQYTSGTELTATKSVQFYPVPKSWYKAQYDGVDGTGLYLEATNVVLTAVEVPQADPEDTSKTPEEVAEEAGVTVSVIENLTPGGADATDAKKKESFNKAMNWAKANDKSTADVATTIKFDADGNPDPTASAAVQQTTEAYLFNVADTEAAVEAAEAGFKFTSITPGSVPEATTTVTPNGTVTVEGKANIGDAAWMKPTDPNYGNAKFYRAVITR